MSVEELISSLGEPRERRPTEPVREGFEVWVYEKKYTVVEMKVTGNKETPHFDPITGVSTPIIDPVYGQESTRVKQTTQFLIAEGRVVSWKVERDQDRDYN